MYITQSLSADYWVVRILHFHEDFDFMVFQKIICKSKTMSNLKKALYRDEPAGVKGLKVKSENCSKMFWFFQK